ncbi:MAG: glycine cleavage system protein H [Deltaproteobacteria bacterium CG_4_10_14_0_2_um_filter_43_8]|nr:MAG: glycine cleavage system protein H [Deltaproteobacteria bacterium CG11_big_fil_rev_8_21_14_0_20_42_23]PJA20912.1 MAG: glycine cleavage system protein H [Deltaproteobacteria bacterium CG_4_10_14_0_2_um_filter_43_8]PJC64592.1 MAG: glycine cleavage system protein H [Deltaproteobacteria bacterium CG_4_9_14_0_2_um_filter_42_21]
MNILDDRRYSKEHEWVKVENDVAFVGVSSHAQEQLGDIVFVELPEVGIEIKASETFGVLESVKAVSDCYSPVSGTVLEVNDDLTDNPEQVNEDCYGEGWMIKVKLSAPSELESLMTHDAYKTFLEEEGA